MEQLLYRMCHLYKKKVLWQGSVPQNAEICMTQKFYIYVYRPIYTFLYFSFFLSFLKKYWTGQILTMCNFIWVFFSFKSIFQYKPLLDLYGVWIHHIDIKQTALLWHHIHNLEVFSAHCILVNNENFVLLSLCACLEEKQDNLGVGKPIYFSQNRLSLPYYKTFLFYLLE